MYKYVLGISPNSLDEFQKKAEQSKAERGEAGGVAVTAKNPGGGGGDTYLPSRECT